MSQAPMQNMTDRREKLLHEMEQDLRRCRAAIGRAVVLRGVWRMALDFVLVLAAGAVAEILSSMIRLFVGETLYRVGIGSLGPGIAGFVVVIVGTCLIAVRAVRRIRRQQPNVGETAERLDLAVEDHNRIATAWWLLRSGQQGPMVDAAIEDGLVHLKLFYSCKPDRSDSVPTLADYRWRLGIAGLLLLVAILFQPEMPYFPGNWGQKPGAVARETQGQKILPAEVAVTSGLPEVKRSRSSTSKRSFSPEALSATAMEASKNLSDSGQESEGFSGHGKSSSALSSSNASAANGRASDASSKTEGQSVQKRDKESELSGKRPCQETEPLRQKDFKGGSSSGSQGNSGNVTMLAAEHDWEQHVQATGSEMEGTFNDSDKGDKNKPSRSANGAQPSLKDRNESSRELGIHEGKGPPSAGRSGPSPPKKSRGTASLVLGVPVPDFVRGHLLPGPVKITHQQVRPVSMGAEPHDVSRAKQRTLPEPVVPRTTLPAETLPLVREYLIRLHQSE